MRRYFGLFVTFVLVAAAGAVIGATSANAATVSRHAPVCADTRLLAIHYVVKGRPSLFGWSVRHRTRPWVVIADTILCDGGYDQRGLIAYVDTGDWNAPLPAGSQLWSFPILDNFGPHA